MSARKRDVSFHMLTLAVLVVQVAVNNNIASVWLFWDTHKMFSQWAGVLRQLYMSAAALVAGWVSARCC
jgi:hypothetical protein